VGALSLPSVSVVGLGLMGRPMARTLLSAGFAVTGWNRSALAEELVAGIPRAESLARAAEADVVLVCLSDSTVIGAVLAQLEPDLRAGSVVLDMGGSEPDDSRERAARLATRGVGWVDAPVSGGPPRADTGTLAIMAGGTDADVATVRPVLDTLGTVAHVGGPGDGHMMKIVNQVVVALSVETVAEALGLAEAVGFTIPEVQRGVAGGSADIHQLRAQGTQMAERDWQPGGRVKTMLKDLHMARKQAEARGLRLPQLDAAIARYQDLVDRGDGDRDISILFELSAGATGVAAFQAITDELLAATRASRTTIRLDRPGAVFPVIAESRAPGVKSIARVEVPGLRQAPTMRYLAETLDVLVQEDLLGTDVPPPKALIEVYGARAQMIAAIVRDGAMAGIVSVHHGPDTRDWTEREVAAIRDAAARAGAVIRG